MPLLILGNIENDAVQAWILHPDARDAQWGRKVFPGIPRKMKCSILVEFMCKFTILSIVCYAKQPMYNSMVNSVNYYLYGSPGCACQMWVYEMKIFIFRLTLKRGCVGGGGGVALCIDDPIKDGSQTQVGATLCRCFQTVRCSLPVGMWRVRCDERCLLICL